MVVWAFLLGIFCTCCGRELQGYCEFGTCFLNSLWRSRGVLWGWEQMKWWPAFELAVFWARNFPSNISWDNTLCVWRYRAPAGDCSNVSPDFKLIVVIGSTTQIRVRMMVLLVLLQFDQKRNSSIILKVKEVLALAAFLYWLKFWEAAFVFHTQK